MKKFLLSVFALLISVSGAWATTYTITYGTSTGSFYDGSGNVVTSGWIAKWVSNEAGKPVVTLTASANNINAANGRMAPGQSTTCTFTLYVEGGYKVTGFSMDCPTFGADVTITPAGESGATVTTGNNIVVNSSAASFVYSGSNSGRICASANDSEYPNASFTITVEEEDWAPSITGAFLAVGDKVESFTAATDADDNDHWYILTQVRGGETPVYNVGTGSQLKRTGTSITTTTLEGASVELSTQYLIRFISAGEGLYNIQFANGDFINSSLNATAVQSQAGKYAFYNSNNGSGSYFGWNKDSNTGDIVDNNGAGNNLAFWGSGTVSGTSGNNIWSIYPVTFTDAISYLFNTTNGAFFQNLTTNKAASDNNYCNLWLSKNEAGKPQLKLITSDASASSGNNIRSTGALFTKSSSYTYNLSVSEGRIKSYTIVGTAVGALSITPAGGTAESFAADATVNKKVTLDSPAKQTSFTLSGSSQWLNVTKFIVEWETDATIVSSTSEITNDGIYTLEPHNAERGVMYAGTEYLDACGGHANTNYPANKNVAIDASDANQQFVLYTYNGNTYLYNIGRAKFAGVADGLYYKLTNTPTNKWVVSSGSYPNYFHITSQADNKMATLNAWVNTGTSDSKNYAIVGGTSNEEANNYVLARVGTLTNELQTAIGTIVENYVTLMTNLDKLDEYTIGTGLGEYTNSDFETEAYKEENIASIRAAAANYDATTLARVKEASATAISNMNINIPATGKFYRIKGYATNKYAKAGNVAATITAATQIPNSVNQESNGSDIWYYDASNHLINYKNGLGTINTHSFATVNNTKETITFQASTCTAAEAKKIGVYEVRSNYNGSQIWYSNTNNVDRNSSNNHVNCEWVLEKVTSLPVTITVAGVATLYSPVALTIPEGVKAYTGAIGEGYISMTEIETTIPKNTGVYLVGNQGTYGFEIAAADVDAIPNNCFTGTIPTIANPGTGSIYALGSADGEYGFYKWSTGNLSGFKAYISTGSAGSNGFKIVFDDDDVTAVEAVIVNGQSSIVNGYYDLQGRKVVAPQKGQLYIHNGKKVLY